MQNNKGVVGGEMLFWLAFNLPLTLIVFLSFYWTTASITAANLQTHDIEHEVYQQRLINAFAFDDVLTMRKYPEKIGEFRETVLEKAISTKHMPEEKSIAVRAVLNRKEIIYNKLLYDLWAPLAPVKYSILKTKLPVRESPEKISLLTIEQVFESEQ